MPHRNAPPHHPPASIEKFLLLAAWAMFPTNNDRRMLRILELLCRHREDGRTWVTRAQLENFWPKPRKADTGHRMRLSQAMSKAMKEFTAQLQTLSWVVPNFEVALDAAPEGRADRYRLVLRKRGAAWDFPERGSASEKLTFSYAFNGGLVIDLPAQVWRARRGDEHFSIEATRETATSAWRAPSHAKAYCAARDDFFHKTAADAKQQGRELHAGELWGIRDVRVVREHQSTAVHLTTTRISYADYVFVKTQLEMPFAALKKRRSFREWLGLHPESGETFCPPLDALCVAVAIVSRAPDRRLYLGRQRRTGLWELTAAGAASSTGVVHVEDKPDLRSQILQVVARETGIKFKKGELVVTWLGFARNTQTRDSSVIALIEMVQAVADIERTFEGRADQRDLDQMDSVKLADLPTWLAKVPPAQRGALLEAGIALVAIHYGLARRE